MKLTFWGATRQVTGSMHMVQLPNGYTILIDCGLDYEQQKRFGSLGDVEFPFHPQDINAVILTHSHIDHSGNLPSLVKQGFRGKIICTPATADITGLLLIDSLNIMEMERNQSNRGKGGKGSSSKKMPFGYKHLRETVDRMVPVILNKKFRITDGVEMEFFNSGHILGAASVLLKVQDGEKELRIGFTGDLGNYNSQLVPDAQPMGELDYLISESTYGGRTHLAQRSPTDELLHYINLACVENVGRLIIPAFSVGRTHAIAFTFHQLYRQGRLPNVKIFADSPLAIKTARYHHKYVDSLNQEAQDMYRRHKDLFEFENLEFVEDAKNSDWLKYEPDPCVIISAAGMVEGGRIQQHIRANISNSSSHILIAGFCAEGTLGYRLLQGQSTLSIKGKDMPVHASVHKTDAFSAHPDNTGLIKYISEANSPKLKKVFLVHGEETSMMALKNNLIEAGITQIETPQKGQSFEI